MKRASDESSVRFDLSVFDYHYLKKSCLVVIDLMLSPRSLWEWGMGAPPPPADLH